MSEKTITNRKNQDRAAVERLGGPEPFNRHQQEYLDDTLCSPDGMLIEEEYWRHIEKKEYIEADRLLREVNKDRVFVSLLNKKGHKFPTAMNTIQWFIIGTDHLDFTTKHTIGLSHKDLLAVKARIDEALEMYDFSASNYKYKPGYLKKYSNPKIINCDMNGRIIKTDTK